MKGEAVNLGYAAGSNTRSDRERIEGEDRRRMALQLAVDHARTVMLMNGTDVVENAKAFEQYLKGE